MRFYIIRVSGLLLLASAIAWITWTVAESGVPGAKRTSTVASRPAPRQSPPQRPQEAESQMSTEAILAAGREPAAFESELDTDLHAQRYAATRMLANDALAAQRGASPAATLRRLRAALYAWDDAVIAAAGYQARGGTLYAHAAMRAPARIEDFLRELVPELPEPAQPARSRKTDDTLLRRITAIEVETFGEKLPRARLDDLQRELDAHKAALATAWLNLERELQALPAPLAARVSKRAIAVYDEFLSD